MRDKTLDPNYKPSKLEMWLHDRKVNKWNEKYDTTEGGKHPGWFMYGIDIVSFEGDICNYQNHLRRNEEIKELASHINDAEYYKRQPGESKAHYDLRLWYLKDLAGMTREQFERLIADPKEKWERRRPGLIAKYMALNPNGEYDYIKTRKLRKAGPYEPLI